MIVICDTVNDKEIDNEPSQTENVINDKNSNRFNTLFALGAGIGMGGLATYLAIHKPDQDDKLIMEALGTVNMLNLQNTSHEENIKNIKKILTSYPNKIINKDKRDMFKKILSEYVTIVNDKDYCIQQANLILLPCKKLSNNKIRVSEFRKDIKKGLQNINDEVKKALEQKYQIILMNLREELFGLASSDKNDKSLQEQYMKIYDEFGNNIKEFFDWSSQHKIDEAIKKYRGQLQGFFTGDNIKIMDLVGHIYNYFTTIFELNKDNFKDGFYPIAKIPDNH